MRSFFTPGARLALTSLIVLLSGGFLPADAHEVGPEALVVSPDGSRLYVNNSAIGAVQVVSTATNQVVGTIPLGSKDDNLPGLAVSPDSTRLYVPAFFTDWPGGLLMDQMLVVDTAAGKVIGTVGVGSLPMGAAVSPDGKRVYVANERSNTVSVVDTGTLQVLASIPVGHGPAGVAASHDGRWVCVSNSAAEDHLGAGPGETWSDTLSVIDAAALQVAATVTVGMEPDRLVVSSDDKRVFVTHDIVYANNIEVIDTTSNHVVATVRASPGEQSFPYDLAISPDGRRLYVADPVRGSVWIVDTTTNQITASVRPGGEPGYVALSPDGKRLYVSDMAGMTVSVIDTATLQVVASLKLGDVAVGG